MNPEIPKALAVKNSQLVVRGRGLPYRADLSDGSDCWVIDSDDGSVAELTCPAEEQEVTARAIAKACNLYHYHIALIYQLRDALLVADGLISRHDLVISSLESFYRDDKEVINAAVRAANQFVADRQPE